MRELQGRRVVSHRDNGGCTHLDVGILLVSGRHSVRLIHRLRLRCAFFSLFLFFFLILEKGPMNAVVSTAEGGYRDVLRLQQFPVPKLHDGMLLVKVSPGDPLSGGFAMFQSLNYPGPWPGGVLWARVPGRAHGRGQAHHEEDGAIRSGR